MMEVADVLIVLIVALLLYRPFVGLSNWLLRRLLNAWNALGEGVLPEEESNDKKDKKENEKKK